jgi:hypothetical protein
MTFVLMIFVASSSALVALAEWRLFDSQIPGGAQSRTTIAGESGD